MVFTDSTCCIFDIWILWDRKGTVDGQGGGSGQVLLKGWHTVEGADEHALIVWELDDMDAVFTLLACSVAAEGLELATIDKAKMWPDWPK